LWRKMRGLFDPFHWLWLERVDSAADRPG
jgi:hypothetical protein